MGRISKLYKQTDWYRPLFVTLENGDEVQLDSIVVYDENGIVVQNNYGYFFARGKKSVSLGSQNHNVYKAHEKRNIGRPVPDNRILENHYFSGTQRKRQGIPHQ